MLPNAIASRRAADSLWYSGVSAGDFPNAMLTWSIRVAVSDTGVLVTR
jgi:hypothetical protein